MALVSLAASFLLLQHCGAQLAPQGFLRARGPSIQHRQYRSAALFSSAAPPWQVFDGCFSTEARTGAWTKLGLSIDWGVVQVGTALNQGW
jgi:hypothetical protein